MRIFLFFILCVMKLLGDDMQGAKLEQITIKNVQIPVIYEKSKILPIGMVELSFVGGGSISNDKTNGLSLLASMILNEGTKNIGSVEFAKQLESKAVTLSASGGFETLSIDLSFLKEQEGFAIDMLGNLIKSPNLTQGTLDKVKTKAISSLLAKENDFDYTANVGLREILFKDTPLEFPVNGDIESIKSINLKNVEDFLRKSLTLNNLRIVIGGDLDIEESLHRIQTILQTLEVGESTPKQFFKANDGEQTHKLYKDTQQAYIYFGSPFEIKDIKKDTYKAKVMAFILGSSGFGSRMMEEIRVKRGLAYSAYMRINLSNTTSYASGYLQTRIKNQDESIELVKEVVKNFVKNGATQEELDSAKSFILGSEPLRNETLSQRLSTAFDNFNMGLPINYNQEELKDIKNLSLSELNNFIKSHIEITKLSFSIVTK